MPTSGNTPGRSGDCLPGCLETHEAPDIAWAFVRALLLSGELIPPPLLSARLLCRTQPTTPRFEVQPVGAPGETPVHDFSLTSQRAELGVPGVAHGIERTLFARLVFHFEHQPRL